MSNRTESVLKDFCKKVSDSTITNPVNTDYDKLFEMLDDDYGKTGADKKKIGVVITQEELNKLEAENEKLRREVDEAEYDRDEFSMDLVDTVAKNKALQEALLLLIEEAANMKEQYGCDCGHLHCRVCADTKTLAIAIDGAEKAIQPTDSEEM